MIHLQGEQPDWYDRDNEPDGKKCTMCGEWSTNVAISTLLNEHYGAECIRDKKGLKEYLEQSTGAPEEEIKDIIQELEFNLKNGIR